MIIHSEVLEVIIEVSKNYPQNNDKICFVRKDTQSIFTNSSSQIFYTFVKLQAWTHIFLFFYRLDIFVNYFLLKAVKWGVWFIYMV